MKNQTPELIKARDKVREVLQMKRAFPRTQVYMKLIGQKTNNVKDAPLQDWEVQFANECLDNVQEVIDNFRKELNG
jgi:hypothetical protein